MARAVFGACVLSYFEDLINNGDLESAHRIMADEVHFHYPLGDLQGAQAVKEYIRAVRVAFPDVHFIIADMVEDDKSAAVRWAMTGTQTGPFKGQPPSGAKVSLPGITFFKCASDRIGEMWIAFDPTLLVKS